VTEKFFGSFAQIFAFLLVSSNRAEIFLIDYSKKNAQIPAPLAQKIFVTDTPKFSGQRLGQVKNLFDAEFFAIKYLPKTPNSTSGHQSLGSNFLKKVRTERFTLPVPVAHRP